MHTCRRFGVLWVAAVLYTAVPVAAGSPAFVVSSADTMEKVFRDEPWNRPAASKLSIEAAGNEVEGVQLVVVAPAERDLRSVTVQTHDLTSESGAVLTAAGIAWHVVG